MSVTVYVEGGGDSAQLKERCRKGFKVLLTKAGIDERLLKVVSCGPRDRTFRSFRNALRDALRNGGEYPILLVDSEELVADANQPDAEPGGAWRHLAQRGGRERRPRNAQDDQAQLMVTTMETWLIADRDALIAYFSPGINENALPPDSELESRRKQDVTVALRRATQPSRKGRYDKGDHSFHLLEQVNPDELRRRLPHFQRFVAALDSRLSAP